MHQKDHVHFGEVRYQRNLFFLPCLILGSDCGHEQFGSQSSCHHYIFVKSLKKTLLKVWSEISKKVSAIVINFVFQISYLHACIAKRWEHLVFAQNDQQNINSRVSGTCMAVSLGFQTSIFWRCFWSFVASFHKFLFKSFRSLTSTWFKSDPPADWSSKSSKPRNCSFECLQSQLHYMKATYLQNQLPVRSEGLPRKLRARLFRPHLWLPFGLHHASCSLHQVS